MNYVYMDKVKLICKMNIDGMYMKLTFEYMTYLYKYYMYQAPPPSPPPSPCSAPTPYPAQM